VGYDSIKLDKIQLFSDHFVGLKENDFGDDFVSFVDAIDEDGLTAVSPTRLVATPKSLNMENNREDDGLVTDEFEDSAGAPLTFEGVPEALAFVKVDSWVLFSNSVLTMPNNPSLCRFLFLAFVAFDEFNDEIESFVFSILPDDAGVVAFKLRFEVPFCCFSLSIHFRFCRSEITSAPHI
jgi:hypothetical protein